MGGLYGIIGNQAFCHTEIKRKSRFGRGCLGSLVQFGSDEGQGNQDQRDCQRVGPPLGHELVDIHVWSEVNVLADPLSRIGNHTTVPEGLRHVRRETLRSRGLSD